MASAKIATLLIRTLAKPIATQLKTQAASHESFRRVCIGIAQRLHRIEMGLRWNLVPKAAPREATSDSRSDDGQETDKGEAESSSSPSHVSRPKVRPLNEAKAIANGATFLSEAFLFTIAASLILGESWRSSHKNRQQRNRTEERVEEVARAVDALGKKLGIDTGLIGEDQQNNSEDDTNDQEGKQDKDVCIAIGGPSREEEEVVRLRKAVDVLLRMAIHGGLIQGQDALDLDGIMQGRDHPPTRTNIEGEDSKAPYPGTASTTPAQSSASPSPSPSPLLQQLAAHRARQLAELSRRQAES